MFKHSDIYYISLTLDKKLNSLVYRTLSYVNMYGSNKLLKTVRFFGPPCIYPTTKTCHSSKTREFPATTETCVSGVATGSIKLLKIRFTWGGVAGVHRAVTANAGSSQILACSFFCPSSLWGAVMAASGSQHLKPRPRPRAGPVPQGGNFMRHFPAACCIVYSVGQKIFTQTAQNY